MIKKKNIEFSVILKNELKKKKICIFLHLSPPPKRFENSIKFNPLFHISFSSLKMLRTIGFL